MATDNINGHGWFVTAETTVVIDSLEVISLIPPSAGTVPDINTSHQGTEDYETYVAGDLIEPGTAQMVVFYPVNLDLDSIVKLPNEDFTFTHPKSNAAPTTAAKTVFNGYVNGWVINDATKNNRVTATLTFKVSGKPEFSIEVA